jgi:lactoylglutathione lyase
MVSDLPAAIKWYSKAFKTEPYFNEPFYVGFNIAGYELGLQTVQKDTLNPKNIFTYWGVDDIQAEFNRLIKLGATVDEEPNNVGDKIEVCSVFDPWNNIIGLIYNPNFKLP